MTIEFVVDDGLHDVDVHFGGGRDSGDLGGDFRPMQEFSPSYLERGTARPIAALVPRS